MKAKSPTANGGATATAVTRRPPRPPPVMKQPMTLMEAIVYAASDPAMDVAKVGELFAMHRQMEAAHAEQAFNTAMAAAQAEMQPVAKDADNPQTSSRFASYAQLDRALRPLYTRQGFALSFDTEPAPMELAVRVVCYVTGHGFTRKYKLDLPADGLGPKGLPAMTRTHATASACSYGMRYLLRLIFNVAVGEGDDDGNAAGQRPKSPAQARRENAYPTLERQLRAASSVVDLEAVWARWQPAVYAWPDRWRQHAVAEKDANKTRLDPMTALTDSLSYLDRESGI